MAVATTQDVADSLGRPLSGNSENVQVQTWLDDAEMQIRLRLGDVTLLDQGALRYVEREAVIYKIRNPAGKAQEQIDDYSYRLNPDAASGQIVILDEWWTMLSPAGAESQAFTIVPAGEQYVARYIPLLGDLINAPPFGDWDVIP